MLRTRFCAGSSVLPTSTVNHMQRKCEFWERVFGLAQTSGDLIVCSIVNFHGPHIPTEVIKQAAYNTCVQHPILLSELYFNTNKELWWKPRIDQSMDNIMTFNVVDCENDATCLKICEKYTTIPISFTEPFMKLFYNKSNEPTTQHQLVILCPHTVIDGMSLLVFIDDFMKQLSLLYEGKNVNATTRECHYLTDSEIISMLVGNKEKPLKIVADDILPIAYDIDETLNEENCTHSFIIDSLNDSQILQNLLLKCKKEGVTLHAAIVAALTIGTSWSKESELDQFSARIASPVSFRHKIAKNHSQGSVIANSMGNMHVFSYDVIRVEKREELDVDFFWQSARDYRKSLQESIENHSYIYNLNNLEMDTVTLYVSNIGSVDQMLSQPYGAFEIESIPFFINFTNPAPFVGVHSQRGKLYMSVSFLEPLYSRNKMQQMIRDCIDTLIAVSKK
jgi:hypothetical protein